MGLFSKKGGEKANASEGSSGKAVIQQTQSTVPAVVAPGEQYRPVFLLCYPSATFKSHWALFAPQVHDKKCRAGRKIHVTGNVQQGFKHEIIRNYDLTQTRTKPLTPLEIGLVSTQHLVEIAEDLRFAEDTAARDAFEQLVLSIPAPSQSLNRVSDDPATRSGPPRRVTLSDCQWWIMRVVEKLVEQGYILPPARGLNKGKSPLEILASAPRH
ncbi:hypothetical protein F4815DRAFT_90977 [Daldinia loculata]|uniref:uncharacterized protein n=1 Tax=Daldinia loculata TaxID=103429 RepID=UPI0020C2DB7E|nr:uncharacterized protein F4817DRAFT_54252 [Daldinia loculata]KAI1648775.1 hypothetical protein F4817DRAFT_54252 [Daldinia loculata]KAI2781304.1 hypothetical protein F4815DRAFT_90977 [Daldinia loculata]